MSQQTTETTETTETTDIPALERLLTAFAAQMVQRSRPFAIQAADGSYRWQYAEVTPGALLGHLDGEVTLALSSADGRGECRWLCLDVDDPAPTSLAWLLALRGALAELGLPGLVEASRRGGHWWLFLDAPLPVATARAAVLAALAHLQARGVAMLGYELYPEGGAQAPGSLGHAVRLPLGIHQLTGKRYPLFDADGQPCAFTSREAALRFVVGWPMAETDTLRDWAHRWSGDAPGGVAASALPGGRIRQLDQGAQGTRSGCSERSESGEHRERVGTRSTVIRWVDAHVSPLDLLADLAPESAMRAVGRGYLGWCPFHDDQSPDAAGKPGTPSFYVVLDRRHGWSWRCLSSNCPQSWGPMRHVFELFQRLLGLSVRSAIVEACGRWPEADSAAHAPHTYGDVP